MPFPIGKVLIRCPNCHWEQSSYQPSDALFGIPDICPQCQYPKLILTPQQSSLKTILLRKLGLEK
ncbi:MULTISPECIES: hypothetical protein [Shewanella]|uniref:hypothetical protein n=1 Tax=Shewanella TaxID=22 RepID=UPI00112A331A|nr:MULTISPECIES: hypothetical protein [Shewanella]TPE46882.1 hypothetical protein FJD33_24760 [Shewanella sp. LC2]